MTKLSLRLAVLAAAATAVSGCSVLGIDFTDEKVQYESSNSRANLEVPPDLTPIGNDNRFAVPSRTTVVSANAEAARQQAAAAQSNTPVGSEIVPATVTVKVMKEGTDRWLRVNAKPEELWPVVQDFWPSVGLVVKAQDAKTGYMETEWAENKAKLPQDIIRRTVGKVLDFAYSTGEQDQYRVRMERNDDSTTDIYITHRSMVEVVTGAQNDSTVWQPGPNDPTMEAEMLQGLALRIDAEFNPNASGKAEEALAEQIKQDLQPEPVPEKSRIVNGADEKVQAVELFEPYDRASSTAWASSSSTATALRATTSCAISIRRTNRRRRKSRASSRISSVPTRRSMRPTTASILPTKAPIPALRCRTATAIPIPRVLRRTF